MNNEYWTHLAQTAPTPTGLKISAAHGIYLYDENNTPHMDLISGIGVNNIGHSHPKIIQAIQTQSEKYLHVMVYGEYEQAPQYLLAQSLCELLPTHLNCVYFTNSGAEANEAAIKLAKRTTGKPHIVSLKNSYHGNTQGAMSVSGNESRKYASRPLIPGTKFIELNNEQELQKIDTQTAAVIIETIQGDAGVRIPSQTYLSQLRKRCDTTNTLLIMDEIQTGIGRTGKWFAFEHFKISPDILTLGKALGGGMPIGAMVANKKLMHKLTYNPMLGHITTFGGHPLPCIAGYTALNILKKENWIKHAQKKAEILAKLIGKHPKVREIRYKGLFFAIDLANETHVTQFLHHLKNEQKALAFRFLSAPFSLRIAPPLCITYDEIEEAAARINTSLDTLI